jgi:two-component system response regulator
MQAPAWGSPFASESLSAIGGGSGLNPSPDKARNSYSRFLRDRRSKPDRRAIVVAEDNLGDVFLIKEAVSTAKLDVDLYFMEDGDEVLQFFAQIDEDAIRCPELLLLDLNLPRADGFQVLSYIRSSKHCAGTRVVVMTSSSAPSDRERSALLGADLFFTKPATYTEFLTLGDVINKFA